MSTARDPPTLFEGRDTSRIVIDEPVQNVFDAAGTPWVDVTLVPGRRLATLTVTDDGLCRPGSVT